jgi:hypothetical protein
MLLPCPGSGSGCRRRESNRAPEGASSPFSGASQPLASPRREKPERNPAKPGRLGDELGRQIADLEQRIVRAELAGRLTVADVLARQLEALRGGLPANVSRIEEARERRRR